MNSNEHLTNAREALGYIESAEGSYVDPTTQALMTAQTEATLALAYEQRTANLIALWSKPFTELRDMNDNPVTYSVHTQIPGKLLEEIVARLDVAL